MFLSILTIAIAIAAVVSTVRNLIFTGLVERSWSDPMPASGEEGHDEAMQTRFRQQRTRVRSALMVAILYGATLVVSTFLAHLWPANLVLVRQGAVVLGAVTMLIVGIRTLMHEQRGTEFRIKREVEQYWKDRERRNK